MFGEGWRRGRQALGIVVRDWRRVLRFGLLPSLLAMLVQLVMPVTAEGGFNWARWPLVLALLVVLLWLSAGQQIRWYRWAVLGDDSPAWWSIPLDARPLRFIGWSLVVGAALALVGVAVALAVFLVLLVIKLAGLPEQSAAAVALPLLALAYMGMKLTPVLVSVAIDRPVRMEAVLRAMGWRRVLVLVLAMLVGILPLAIVVALLGGIVGAVAALLSATDKVLGLVGLLDMVAGPFLLAALGIVIGRFYADHLVPVLDGVPESRGPTDPGPGGPDAGGPSRWSR